MQQYRKIKLSEFDYNLPQELIAQYPADKRDESRLIVLDREKREISHKRFNNITDYLGASDLLVLNNTRVIPAHIIAHKKSGGKIDLLLTKEIEKDIWETLVKQSGKIKEGATLYLDSEKSFCIEKREGKYIADFSSIPNAKEWILANGFPPLPPYIRKGMAEGDDKERYQTVYAAEEGAIAAPTAGLHFTDKLLEKIREGGTDTAFVTLHVGIGTFQPVRTEIINEHEMHYERYSIPEQEAAKINDAIRQGKKIVAVGTTSIRTLETSVGENGFLEKLEGESNLFILPGYKFKLVDKIITNFHPPKSTPLFLVSAFAGEEFINESYSKAIEEKYRFCSYGDAMLII